jgi:hypothetical protein
MERAGRGRQKEMTVTDNNPATNRGAANGLRAYVTVGLGIGLIAGAAEALFVHRPGAFYIPFAAEAYGVLFGASFLVLGLIAKAVCRNLLPVGLGLATLCFVGLEAGFWVNFKASPLEEATSAKASNAIVLAASLAVGLIVFFVARRRAARLGPWRPTPWIALAVLVLLAGFFGISSRARSPGLNCVLISVDALRADHLHTYGYPRLTSPTLDALAAKSTIWERDYTQSPGTTGGHAAMLTGLYTLSSGAYLNGFPLDPKVTTLAEVFAADGYATGAFVNNWYISPALGFGQGFDCFVDGGKAAILKDAGPRIFLRGLLLYQVIHRSLVPPGAPTDLEVVDAIRWISRHQHHRFFVFMHILDPHSPYVPPHDLIGRFGGSGDALDPAYLEGLHAKSLESDLAPEEQQILIDRYDEEVLSADRKIGRVLEALDRLGLRANTLVVVTADHGEMMNESSEKQFGHGVLDYVCLHVPLVVSLPGKVPQGLRARGIAQTIDLVPTITRLVGLRDDARRQGAPLLSSDLNLAAPDLAAFTTGDIEARDEYSVVTDRWQYVILGNKVSLYGLGPDAGAGPPPSALRTSVIGAYPAVADSLQALIEGWIKRCADEAVVPYSLKGRSVTPGREALQRLKALGYVQ